MIKPTGVVSVESSDYIARIGFLIIGIWIAYFVNKIYILRLRENVEQVRIQSLISDVSANFVTINVVNFDDRINYALQKCAEHFHIEIATLGIFDHENSKVKATHKWCKNIELDQDSLREVDIDPDLWWIKKLQDNEIVNFTEENDPMSHKNNFLYTNRLIPIVGNHQVLGFLEFSMLEESKKWRKDQDKLLQTDFKCFCRCTLEGKCRKRNQLYGLL